MKNEPLSRFYAHRSAAKKPAMEGVILDLLTALKAAAIILSVVAAIVIFHG